MPQSWWRTSQIWALEPPETRAHHVVATSALTGEGIAELRAAILRHVAGDGGGQTEAGFLTNVRHQGLVHDSLTALDAARTAVANKIPHEMLLLDLYNALRPLDEVTGATTTDDILNSDFQHILHRKVKHDSAAPLTVSCLREC